MDFNYTILYVFGQFKFIIATIRFLNFGGIEYNFEFLSSSNSEKYCCGGIDWCKVKFYTPL